MKHQELTTAVAMNDAPMPPEVSSHLSTSVGKSKSSFRLFLFTVLSVLACAGALANVAAAATPSGEDQYIEKTPTGGGTSDPDSGVDVVDTNGDGVVTEAEVRKAAEKNKKKMAEAGKDDDGATGATGAVAPSTPAPPAAESIATAAKFGPLSRSSALLLGGLVLLGGVGFFAFGGGSSGLFGLGDRSDGASPAAPE